MTDAYVAFDIPPAVDPDDWARALLAQIERDIRQGRRRSDDRPRVFISSESIAGRGEPPQVIAEKSAYTAVVKFDVRKFEAFDLDRRDLPNDVVEVKAVDQRPGRVFCFSSGLWRVERVDSGELAFTNVATAERRLTTGRSGQFSDEWLDQVYASEILTPFEASVGVK